MKQMKNLKALILCILCLCAFNCVVACEDFGKNMKFEYGYSVVRHNVKGSDIAAIEQALNKHSWQSHKNLTKDEAQEEWESFLNDINDEEVEIADGGYVKVKFHEVFSMTNDEIIQWYEGNIVGEKTWD